MAVTMEQQPFVTRMVCNMRFGICRRQYKNPKDLQQHCICCKKHIGARSWVATFLILNAVYFIFIWKLLV